MYSTCTMPYSTVPYSTVPYSTVSILLRVLILPNDSVINKLPLPYYSHVCISNVYCKGNYDEGDHFYGQPR